MARPWLSLQHASNLGSVERICGRHSRRRSRNAPSARKPSSERRVKRSWCTDQDWLWLRRLLTHLELSLSRQDQSQWWNISCRSSSQILRHLQKRQPTHACFGTCCAWICPRSLDPLPDPKARRRSLSKRLGARLYSRLALSALHSLWWDQSAQSTSARPQYLPGDSRQSILAECHVRAFGSQSESELVARLRSIRVRCSPCSLWMGHPHRRYPHPKSWLHKVSLYSNL